MSPPPTLPTPTPTPPSPVPHLIQFRSYQHDIQIYHIRLHTLSLRHIRRTLRSHPAYTDTLTSFDPLHHIPRPPGDETPPQCLEAAYLPSVFHGAGSALGVRDGDAGRGRVEWICFRGPVGGFLEGVVGEEGRVFDLVGFVQKGLVKRRVRGANAEHKGWHDSLRCAERKRVRVRITWRRYGKELKDWREGRGGDGDEDGDGGAEGEEVAEGGE